MTGSSSAVASAPAAAAPHRVDGVIEIGAPQERRQDRERGKGEHASGHHELHLVQSEIRRHLVKAGPSERGDPDDTQREHGPGQAQPTGPSASRGGKCRRFRIAHAAAPTHNQNVRYTNRSCRRSPTAPSASPATNQAPLAPPCELEIALAAPHRSTKTSAQRSAANQENRRPAMRPARRPATSAVATWMAAPGCEGTERKHRTASRDRRSPRRFREGSL